MNKSAALFISVILLTQIASYSFNETQSDLDREEFTADESWEVSGRNNTTGANNNSTSDAHCLVLNNLTMNQTYYVSIYLVNTCSDGINYPGINASSDNSGVELGLQEMWWYVIPGANTNSSNISDYPYYHMNLQLSLNQSIPNGTTITLYFEATVLHCGPNNSWSNDCPNSSDSNLSYQFITPGYTQSGNQTNGNNTAGNNTGGNNSTNTIPNYYFDESYGLDFNSVSNIMNGTYVPTTVVIQNYENNSTTTDHMLAVTFYSDGDSEQKTTQYVAPPVSGNTISFSQYVHITSDTTYVEVSMDVLECRDEECDMSKTPEDRYYPADYQYYQSYSSTYIPRVVELMDEIYDLDDGEDIPRFTFEMEEIEFGGEMYYSIVVTNSQMDFATQCIDVLVYWTDENGAGVYDEWNLAENIVYGFYPGNSGSIVTFIDQVDIDGDSVISTYGVGDTIFVKAGSENGTSVGGISIAYAPDDMTGATLRSWDFGGLPVIDDDNSAENNDDNDTEDDSESSGLPSIGVFGTLAAMAVSFVAVIRREQEE